MNVRPHQPSRTVNRRAAPRRATPRSARQVVEMNIVRGRGIRRKNVAERKNGGRDRAALESMRMSGGSERDAGRNGERADRRLGGERGVATEKRSPRENEGDRETGECDEEVNDATVRARMTEGTTLQGARRGRYNAARAVVRESEVWPAEGVADYLCRVAGGRDGDRSPAHARRAWERALMPRQSPVLSLAPLPRPLPSRSLRESPVPLARSRASSLPSSTALSLSLSLSLPRPLYRRGPLALSLSNAVGTHRRAPPITAECARSKAPRARVLIRSGVLSIWVIANVNKDNTWRTIMSRNYSRRTDHNCAGFSSAAIMLRRPSPG